MHQTPEAASGEHSLSLASLLPHGRGSPYLGVVLKVGVRLPFPYSPHTDVCMQRHCFSPSLEAPNLDCAPSSAFLYSLNIQLPLPAPCPAPEGFPALSTPLGLFAGGRGTWDLPWSISLPSVLGCKEADISHLGSPCPSPKKGALLKDYTQRLRRPGFPAGMQKGAGPPGQAVCRIFSSHQSVLPQLPLKRL